MKNREYMIYAEQLICGYRRHGRICAALKECREVLPANGALPEAVEECQRTILGCEETEEKETLRQALSRLENGDVRLTLLHDVIAVSEETGRDCKKALQYLEESLSPVWDECLCVVKKRRVKSHTRKAGKKAVEAELPGWMLGMVIYCSVFGFQEAVRRSTQLVHGAFRACLRHLARELEQGNPVDLCGAFLSDLSIPEIRLCMMNCLRGNDDGEVVLSACLRRFGRGNGQTDNSRRKVMAAAASVAVGIVLMIGVTSFTDTKKEQHLREALTGAMSVTVGESMQITETNQMLAIFMQNMLKSVDDDIDLTVRICEMDEKKKTMDVEAIGEYDLGLGRRRVCVRRRVAF